MKGGQVDQFHVGQRVMFRTDIGHKVYRDGAGKDGKPTKVFDHNVRIPREDYGRISKLHKSGRHGVAEIKPEHPMPRTGYKKLSRRLQHVEAA